MIEKKNESNSKAQFCLVNKEKALKPANNYKVFHHTLTANTACSEKLRPAEAVNSRVSSPRRFIAQDR